MLRGFNRISIFKDFESIRKACTWKRVTDILISVTLSMYSQLLNYDFIPLVVPIIHLRIYRGEIEKNQGINVLVSECEQ